MLDLGPLTQNGRPGEPDAHELTQHRAPRPSPCRSEGARLATPEAHSRVRPRVLETAFDMHLLGCMTLPPRHPWMESSGFCSRHWCRGRLACWVQCQLLALCPPWAFSGPRHHHLRPSSGGGGPSAHISRCGDRTRFLRVFSSRALPSPASLAGVSPVPNAWLLCLPSDNRVSLLITEGSFRKSCGGRRHGPRRGSAELLHVRY